MKNLPRFVLTIALALLAALALAAPPPTINYQGYLTTNPGGTPVNSTVGMTFKFYTAASAGTLLHTELQPSVTVTNGNFNVLLGSPTPIPLPFDVPYWLTVTITGDAEMSPRQPLASSPYAFRAAALDSAATIQGSQISGTIANVVLPASPSLTGNLTLADPSTASAGNIMKGANRFIHNYGPGNTSVGMNSGNFLTTGSSNTAIGESALQKNTAGNNNTAIGSSAFANNTNGSNSIAIGVFAGGNVTSGIGNIHIGNFGLAADSAIMRIGSGGVQTKTFIAGIRSVTPAVNDALPVVIDSQGQLGTGAGGGGGGTVTSIATGPGLTGGAITATGTIGLAATNLLPPIACATNQIVKWNGSAWVCASSLPTLYTGTVIVGQPVVTPTPNDRSTWQVMGVVTPPAGNYFVIARVNGQTESNVGGGLSVIECELLLEPTVPRPRIDLIGFYPPLGLGGSIQKHAMAGYVTVPPGGTISLRCQTYGTLPIPVSTLIGSGSYIHAIPVGGQVYG